MRRLPGLAAVLFTRYWLWGPILAVAGTRATRPEFGESYKET